MLSLPASPLRRVGDQVGRAAGEQGVGSTVWELGLFEVKTWCWI